MSIDIALGKNIYLKWENRDRTAAYRRYFRLRFRLLAGTFYFINHFVPIWLPPISVTSISEAGWIYSCRPIPTSRLRHYTNWRSAENAHGTSYIRKCQRLCESPRSHYHSIPGRSVLLTAANFPPPLAHPTGTSDPSARPILGSSFSGPDPHIAGTLISPVARFTWV